MSGQSVFIPQNILDSEDNEEIHKFMMNLYNEAKSAKKEVPDVSEESVSSQAQCIKNEVSYTWKVKEELMESEDNKPETSKVHKLSRGEKKRLISGKPKHPSSAYLLWLIENRARITKPGMGVPEVAKIAKKEFKNLKDKSKWEKAAYEDKNRYDQEMSVYRSK